MRIQDKSGDPRPDPVKPVRGVAAGVENRPTAQPAGRMDRVQISDAARALVAQPAADTETQLDPVRAAEIRRRVLEGAYDSLEMADNVARRILERGDL